MDNFPTLFCTSLALSISLGAAGRMFPPCLEGLNLTESEGLTHLSISQSWVITCRPPVAWIPPTCISAPCRRPKLLCLPNKPSFLPKQPVALPLVALLDKGSFQHPIWLPFQPFTEVEVLPSSLISFNVNHSEVERKGEIIPISFSSQPPSSASSPFILGRTSCQ